MRSPGGTIPGPSRAISPPSVGGMRLPRGSQRLPEGPAGATAPDGFLPWAGQNGLAWRRHRLVATVRGARYPRRESRFFLAKMALPCSATASWPPSGGPRTPVANRDFSRPKWPCLAAPPPRGHRQGGHVPPSLIEIFPGRPRLGWVFRALAQNPKSENSGWSGVGYTYGCAARGKGEARSRARHTFETP